MVHAKQGAHKQYDLCFEALVALQNFQRFSSLLCGDSDNHLTCW